MPHIGDVRGAKCAFQISTVLSFVKQSAASTVGKAGSENAASWDSVGEFFGQVIGEANRIVHMSLEVENMLKSKLPQQWTASTRTALIVIFA